MNLDELDNSATDSDSGHSIDPDTKNNRNQQSSQEALGLPSVPFDPEWVSPFTLPPLPALRKNRGHSNLLRSPEERLHERSTSSAYYAAAWGSPYATPSPNRSPPQQRRSRRSQDIETASPLSSRIRTSSPKVSGQTFTSRIANPKPESKISGRQRASSWDRVKSLSERSNWLSESDLSEGEANIRVERTPTRDTYLKSLAAPVDSVKVSKSRSHQVRESIATVTPETFNAEIDGIGSEDEDTQAFQVMEQNIAAAGEERPSSTGIAKPLPSLPSLNMVEKRAEIAPTTNSPDSPSRPRLQSVQSFQRPKRKVAWKGKTCIIALPLTDRESEGLPPLLESSEIKERMQRWVADGYDITDLMAGGPQDISAGFGQSRSLFPDPKDLYAERKSGTLHVHIPDQNEWDAWVEYLKEERLRALGVTPSNSEPPMSIHSPFSSTLSRVSSTYPSLAASPPVGTLSANGNPIRIASNTFSPPLGHHGSMSSHGGSHVASPSISGYPGPMHGYKQSIAHQRMTSPYDYSVSHPGSFGPGTRNTPGGYGMRQFSPPTAANLQSLGQVLSPMVPSIPSNDPGRGMAQNPTMEQIRQHQQRQQQMHQHMQHQRQYSYFPPQPTKSADNLPRTPVVESPSRHTPEIMHPTPRSHRHNLSAALQKGVDDAEAARGDGKSSIGTREDQQSVSKIDDGTLARNIVEDEQEPELPVLKRPETMADADDKSEIETNPSIAASPMLMNEKNPFAESLTNIQQLKEALQPHLQHKPKPSMSKLNVEAPEFDPRAVFSSSNFSFAASAFQPSSAVPASKPLVPGTRPSFPTSNLSISKLNVDAPSFTPSFLAQATPTKDATPVKTTPAKQVDDTPTKSPFTFSSPSFNVDAPEFKPGQSFSFTANSNPIVPEDRSFQPSLTSAGSIFGSVIIDPNSKVNRRGPKIVPIIRPKSAEDKEEEQVYDAAGRVAAPSDRQKRARHVGGDEDEELLFANSAPFDHTNGLSGKNDASTEEPVRSSGAAPLAETTDQLTGVPVVSLIPASSEDSVEQSKDITTETPVKAPKVEEELAETEANSKVRIVEEPGHDVVTTAQPIDSVMVENYPTNFVEFLERKDTGPSKPEVDRDYARDEITQTFADTLPNTLEDALIADNDLEKSKETTDLASAHTTPNIVPGSATYTNTSSTALVKPSPQATTDKIGDILADSESVTVVGAATDKAVHTAQELIADTVDKDVSDLRNNMSPNKPEVSEVATSRHSGPVVEEQPTAQQLKIDQPNSQAGHKTRSSLSALAKPFEFNSGAAATFVPAPSTTAQQSTEPKKSRGLMASRFAAASPQPEPSVVIERNSSPSRDMYEYIESEAVKFDDSPSHQEQLPQMTPALKMPDIQFKATPQIERSIEESFKSESQRRPVSHSSSQGSMVDESMPSYEEIDAVMKQFENNPDLGVERDNTPVKSTPLIDMRFPPIFRSDAPSPSPRRMTQSPQRRTDWGLGIHKLNDGNEEISDWNEEFSPQQEEKLQSQATYFDSHVNHLVGGILENRLVPLEETLHSIQGSILSLLGKKPRPSGRRSLSTENKDSDADDEDDYDAFEGFSSYRSRSPSRNQRKTDKVRAIVMEAMAAFQPQVSNQPAIDMSEIHAALHEIRKLSQKSSQSLTPEQPDTRAIMEEVISNHPQFRIMKIQEDQDAAQEQLRLEMEVLQTSLHQAEKRAVHEMALREQNHKDIEILRVSLKEAEKRALEGMARHQQHDKERDQFDLKLKDAQQQVNHHREALDEAQISLRASEREKEAYLKLQTEYADLVESNNALEETLQEYRVSSNQFRDDIKLERARNQDLIRIMHNLREDFQNKLESRQALRSQMERLQDRIAQVMHDVHTDEAEWRRKEHEYIVQNKTTQAALDHEVRHREKIELELDTLDKEHKENMRFKAQHDHAQQELTRLREQVKQSNNENKLQQDQLFKLERELAYLKDSTDGEVSKATTRLQSDLEAARATVESQQTDYEAQLVRLQKRLDDSELDLEDQKTKHDILVSETVDAHTQALQEATQKRDSALEEQLLSHENKLNDLRERHTRALHNSSDDRHRLEHQLNEKLAISEDRAKHLESQVKDLEERLEISKSAARAAVQAATIKGINLPTPAPSVVASPPQRLSGASLQLMNGSDLPEKISPQAMRESIMVLQDQLQNREQTIEHLEAEIAGFDKEAPIKVKERDNEIALLRELLSVRVDDLNEIIMTLSQPKYDQEATKNAAIRLKANLQMEQQLKERAASIGGLTSSLPSISTLSNFAQSPRGLPLAAAAAWGNWRKARDFSLNAVSDIATNISQTPSKSTAGSPSSFLAGIMTPPSTSQRTPPPSEANSMSPPTMRPLAAAALARKNSGIPSEARPLRTYSTQARTLSSRQPDKRRESSESSSSDTSRRQGQPQPETPTTPTMSRNSRNIDLGDDVDEDASPFDINKHTNRELESKSKKSIAA